MLNVIENVSDAVNRHLLKVVDPLINNFEDSLVLVGLADVLDDILAVGAVDAEHLCCIILVLQLLEDLGVNGASELDLPAGLAFDHHAGQSDADDDQKLLMNIEHEILQVGVDAGLCIYCGLLVRQQVIKLDDTDRNSFIFLGLEHYLFQTGVLNDLIGDDCCEVACFGYIPPVIAVEGSIQVIAQTL